MKICDVDAGAGAAAAATATAGFLQNTDAVRMFIGKK